MARRPLIVGAGLLVIVILMAVAIRQIGNPNSAGGQTSSAPKVVLYCATDREIAQDQTMARWWNFIKSIPSIRAIKSYDNEN
jgi:hypothetical protein